MTMTDNNTLRQLQAHITNMERRQKEELRKLKVDRNELEAHVKRP